jgi:acid phosphatase
VPVVSVPQPDHVVVVVEENHSFADIIGRPDAPYLNSLAGQGALFTQSFAVAHPSEPNYLALFSGSTQGITDDSCPHTFTTPNLGAQLISAGHSFAGYSEGLPAPGATVCSAGEYARKHNPWVNFPSVPASANLPFSAFPTDYASLPTVSFVIPNLANDMHDGSISQGDSWLRTHLDGYVQWAMTHRSLLVVTWDEDDLSQANQVPTIIVGAQVKPGRYAERITHYSVLRTLETAYGLPPVGAAASATAITDCWITS